MPPTLRQAARVTESHVARTISEIASVSRRYKNEVASTEQQLRKLQGNDLQDLQQAIALLWTETLQRVQRIVENHMEYTDQTKQKEEHGSAVEAHTRGSPTDHSMGWGELAPKKGATL